MQIQYLKQSYNNSSNPSFGQIRPKHLYINIKGYGKNKSWAKSSIKIIDEAKLKMQKGLDFKRLMDFVSQSYSNAVGNDLFGRLREHPWSSKISGRYEGYKQRLIVLSTDQKKLNGYDAVEDSFFSFKRHITKMFSETYKNNLHFTEVIIVKNGDESKDGYVKIISPEKGSIKLAFEEITPVYKRILKNNQELSKDKIQTITKDIAKIHWILSQVRPYCRGSAGIADIVAKSLFEAKGIQVSSYKKGLDPNLEAFVMPVEKYMDEYENFFSSPLKSFDDVQKENASKSIFVRMIEKLIA